MKFLFEQLGGTYHWEGDYLIPDLELPDEDEKPIGIWGQRHERWLKQEHRALYHNLMFHMETPRSPCRSGRARGTYARSVDRRDGEARRHH